MQYIGKTWPNTQHIITFHLFIFTQAAKTVQDDFWSQNEIRMYQNVHPSLSTSNEPFVYFDQTWPLNDLCQIFLPSVCCRTWTSRRISSPFPVLRSAQRFPDRKRGWTRTSTFGLSKRASDPRQQTCQAAAPKPSESRPTVFRIQLSRSEF